MKGGRWSKKNQNQNQTTPRMPLVRISNIKCSPWNQNAKNIKLEGGLLQFNWCMYAKYMDEQREWRKCEKEEMYLLSCSSKPQSFTSTRSNSIPVKCTPRNKVY